MKGKYFIIPGLMIMGCFIYSCKKPYTPPVTQNSGNYLIVEGNINTGNDSSVIKLSRSVNLSAETTVNPELNAIITIQDDQNQSYPLRSLGNGFYTSAILNLDNTHKYRISINTADGKTYLSDLVAAVTTPPIDSVGFIIKDAALQVYVNTHDSKNSTHYYRWDYSETWLFHTKYDSEYISNGTDTILVRPPSKAIYQCYGNDISTEIILGSSAKLQQDVIYQQPISLVAATSEKIETRYSILVKQYAMTTDGYNYYSQLKKNTENLGSIFDAQPSQLTGNVHCTTDALLPVIGYVTAGTVQQKRIFINNSQVPGSWTATYPYDCQADSLWYSHPLTGYNDILYTLIPQPNSRVPLFPFSKSSSGPGFLTSDLNCADCTIRGTTTKPSFWQ